MRWIMGSFMLAPLLIAAASPAAPGWLYPAENSTLPPVAVPTELPGSPLHPRADQLHDLAQTVDWYPADHPAPPDIVLHGHGAANACGFCHMANGVGRPENAAIAGLDADYIRRAVHGYADGSRGSPMPGYLAHSLMAATARAGRLSQPRPPRRRGRTDVASDRTPVEPRCDRSGCVDGIAPGQVSPSPDGEGAMAQR